MQKVEFFVVDDFQNVGVARNEKGRFELQNAVESPAVVVPRIAADVGDEYVVLFAADRIELLVKTADIPTVDVSADGMQRLEGGDAIGELERSDVAGMPDLVHPGKELPQRVIEKSMRIRYDPYAFHDKTKIVKFFAFQNRLPGSVP